jgi:hypothetical protein
MAEFQWWLLLVGLVAGGGLVAVVFLDGARREQDIEEAELPAEAHWIAARLRSGERRLDPHQVEAILREHREYRLMPPPDRLDPIDAPPAGVVEANPVGLPGAPASATGDHGSAGGDRDGGPPGDRDERRAGESRPPR